MSHCKCYSIKKLLSNYHANKINQDAFYACFADRNIGIVIKLSIISHLGPSTAQKHAVVYHSILVDGAFHAVYL